MSQSTVIVRPPSTEDEGLGQRSVWGCHEVTAMSGESDGLGTDSSVPEEVAEASSGLFQEAFTTTVGPLHALAFGFA